MAYEFDEFVVGHGEHLLPNGRHFLLESGGLAKRSEDLLGSFDRLSAQQRIPSQECGQIAAGLIDRILVQTQNREPALFVGSRFPWQVEPPMEAVAESADFHSLEERVAQDLFDMIIEISARRFGLDECPNVALGSERNVNLSAALLAADRMLPEHFLPERIP